MRVYLDTMVWIYAFENHPIFGTSAQQVFRDLKTGRHTTITSHFLLAEVLVLPTRVGNAFSVTSYKRAMLASDSVILAPFDMQAAIHFANIRAAHRIKQPDAIHLALAASAGADLFLTTDTRLSKLTLPGIGHIGDLNTNLT